ncbi:MAG TPA: hypothetical protein VFE34_26595 [Dongiaceae bacterium]|jgi:hypothetical protein|nr:hypothetical protein [Dongiaceae bacterium]
MALGLAWGSAPAFAQDELNRCIAPIMAESKPVEPAAFWNDDREVSVWRRQDGESFAYYIVGDIVELTPRSFSALATEPGQALRGISEISVDAREIVVAMPIRLANGVVKLYGDKVRFTGDGTISLTDLPAQQDQSVEIVTDTLDLSHAPDMPFVLQTQGWVLNATPQWPSAVGPKRLLRIKARTVIPGADASDESQRQLKDDPLRWFHNKTADQGFDSGLPKNVWSSGYDIAIGDAAGSIYDAMFGATLLWPDVAVAKLSRLRAEAPFDPAVDAFVRAKIDELMPRLSRRASKQAIGALTLMREQMVLGVDPFGYAPNEVPMTGLSDRLKTFQKSLDTVFGTAKRAGTLELWDQTRMAALAAGKMTDASKQIDQLDRMLRVQSAGRAAAARRISGNSDQLLKMVQDGTAKITEAAGIDETLLARHNEEKEQALTFGRIVDDLIVNDTTIGIGHPAAAPYSLGWNPEATAPVSYYGNKDTGRPSGAPGSLREIIARYQSYAALIGDFSAAWKAIDPHLAPAFGHLSGKQKNDAELAAFDKAMDDVFEKGEALRAGLKDGPAEFTLALNDYTPVDPEQQKKWTSLLQEAEAQMATAGNLQAMILADEEHVRAIDADIRWLSAMREDLLTLKSLPKEAAVQRQALLSSAMRARLLTGVARSAMVLRKGFYYVTGQESAAPDEALHPGNDVLAAQGVDARHPELYDPAQMQVALEADRTALNQYYESFAGGLAEQAGAFVDKWPAIPPSVEFFRAAYDDDLGHDLDASYLRARFLDSLNRSIAAQVALGRTGAGFASRPILVPISITPPSPSGGAQFLMGIAVTKVHFDGEPKMQSRIDLRIEHPRWGSVTLDGICHHVIDATDNPDGLETGYSKTISLPREVKEDWKASVPIDQAFAKILDNAFPLDAPYYAYVDVAQPSSWTNAPVIDEIEILFVKTGTKLE